MVLREIDTAQLAELLNSSNNFAEVLFKLGYKSLTQYYYTILKQRIESEKIVFKFVEKATIEFKYKLSSKLRKSVLTRDNFTCTNCQHTGLWCGKYLSLHVDHIDGDRSNNDLRNLRTLCPNCHSQTDTYGGKNVKKKHLTRNCKCGKLLNKKSKGQCADCYRHSRKAKAAQRINKTNYYARVD